MTVSGPGSARSPRPFPASAPRAVRAAKRPAAARSDAEHLSGADRQLIRHVTGEREPTSGFAAAIAADRAAGRLAPGQEVTVVYLKDLERRYARAGGPNPVTPYLVKAVAYLSRIGARSIDVTA
jgi:hypothetical protein